MLPRPAFGIAKPPPPSTTATTTATPRAANALAGPTPELSADAELILEIRTQHGEMTDTITGYGLRQGVYLPLGAIARLLDLPIAISDNGHYAAGWFLGPNRKLTLNLREGKLTVEGHDIALGSADAAAYEGELYLRATRFADILPLALTVDLHSQSVLIKTREPFPYEQRAAREQARERVAGKGATAAEKHWPREPTPWSMLSVPLGELETRAITDSTQGARVETDLRLAGDIAKMTGQLFISTASNAGITAARLELGRKDPDSALLGPLHASEFELGDIASVALPIGLRSVSGRGAFVTNTPLGHVSVFDTVDLVGELRDGYEVELYRNNTLIGSTNTPVNGRYQFLGVPVDFGLNLFRLVFYGPQGQRREEAHGITVGDGRLPKGQLLYSAGVVQKDTTLFAINGASFTPTTDDGAWRAVALAQYGVSRALTATLGGGWFQSGGVDRWQTYGGLRTGLGGLALKLDLGAQSGGGLAAVTGIGGRLFGITYVLTHGEYAHGYIDEVRSNTELPLTRATDLDLTTSLHLGGGMHGGGLVVPLSGHFDTVTYANGQSQTDASLRGTLAVARFVVSNTMDYASSRTPGFAASGNLLGAFDLASFASKTTQYRATLGYALLPRPAIEAAGVEVDRMLGTLATLKGGIAYTVSNHEALLDIAAQRRFGPFALSFDGSYGVPHRDFTFTLRLGFSFGRNPITHAPFISRPGLTSGGAVLARAFVDASGDGRFEPGDTPLAGVAFNASAHHATTDATGMALISGIGDGTRATLTMDTASLPDIALAPASEGIAIVPRPGRIHIADFPVVALSDIEGTAYFESAGGEAGPAKATDRAVSGLVLWLVDAHGKRVAHVRTEVDGYFLFEQLHPGDYTLALDSDQAKNLAIHIDHPATIHLGPKSSSPRIAVRVRGD